MFESGVWNSLGRPSLILKGLSTLCEHCRRPWRATGNKQQDGLDANTSRALRRPAHSFYDEVIGVRAGEAGGLAKLMSQVGSVWRRGPGLSAAQATTKHNEPTTGSQGQSVNPTEKQKSTFSSRLIQLPLTGWTQEANLGPNCLIEENRRESRALFFKKTRSQLSGSETGGSGVYIRIHLQADGVAFTGRCGKTEHICCVLCRPDSQFSSDSMFSKQPLYLRCWIIVV